MFIKNFLLKEKLRLKLRLSSLKKTMPNTLYVDNVFNKNFLNEIKKNFPLIEGNNDSRGNKCFLLINDLNDLETKKKEFWKNFVDNINPVIISSLTLKFSKSICSRFKTLIDDKEIFNYGTLMLSQNAQDNRDFNAHYHFNNDPLWVLTILFYVEDQNHNAPGTTFYSRRKETKHKEYIKHLIEFNKIRTNKHITYSQQRKLFDKLLSKFDRETIDFKENRLLCFFDDFNSIHSVEYNNNKSINRKILRISVGFDRSKCDKVYGISIEKFNNIFNNHNEKEVKNIFENCLKINTKLTESKTLNKLKNLQIQKLT